VAGQQQNLSSYERQSTSLFVFCWMWVGYSVRYTRIISLNI
jgi:hypothetical protein